MYTTYSMTLLFGGKGNGVRKVQSGPRYSAGSSVSMVSTQEEIQEL